MGASVRNFGMIWPVGQPDGPSYQLANRSRDIWLEVLAASGIWHRRCGSLHVAYHEDEAQVLREFAAATDRPCEVRTPEQVVSDFPAIVRQGLHAGLWSPTELAVDPRQVIAELPGWLEKQYGVAFAFDTTVRDFDLPRIATTQGDWRANRLVVCTGVDFRELAPEAFADSGLYPVKLQMMRSQPFGDEFQIGTHLAAGLTLRHYATFRDCPSLPAVARRFDEELPEYHRLGIHVMASQNGAGELTLGDSHVYGDAIDPFDDPHIDDLVLDYLRTFLTVPGLRIASRWSGVYIKHPTKPFAAADLGPNALAVTGVGGAGMTLSFGLAEQMATEVLGEKR